MARTRKWYERLIGYCFSYNNREVVLDDIFYYEENGKVVGTGYEMLWVDTNESFICDYKVFKELISQTDYPN